MSMKDSGSVVVEAPDGSDATQRTNAEALEQARAALGFVIGKMTKLQVPDGSVKVISQTLPGLTYKFSDAFGPAGILALLEYQTVLIQAEAEYRSETYGTALSLYQSALRLLPEGK